MESDIHEADPPIWRGWADCLPAPLLFVKIYHGDID